MYMINPRQVQLRGGTSEEHEGFIGAPREITIDTTHNTIRVHDGKSFGGYSLCKMKELADVSSDINKRIDDMQDNLGGSHNHDDKYSSIEHEHDDRYLSIIHGCPNVISINKNGYKGLCGEDCDDGGWFRTTMSGLLPYQSGGYSSIGTSSWRFNEGWFNTLNSTNLNSDNVVLGGGSTRQYTSVKFNSQNSNKRIEYDATNDRLYVAGTKNSASGLSSMEATSFISTNYAMIGGNRLYIQSSDPGNVPVGSVWIKI